MRAINWHYFGQVHCYFGRKEHYIGHIGSYKTYMTYFFTHTYTQSCQLCHC